ncbi:MAG: DUF2726 domain-containing protein [Ginsengibacter sp.]
MAISRFSNDITMIDRETIFQLVNKKNWQKLIDTFKLNDNYTFVSNDPVLKPLIDQYFIDELLSKSSMDQDPAYKYYLQTFFILHNGGKYSFKLSDNNFQKLIVKIVEVETELARAYDYALYFPEIEICKLTIEKFKEREPKFVKHSQDTELIVTENKNISEIDSSIGIFKSIQEYHFYKAIRDVFQMFLVFPNVALSAVIDFDKIKNELTSQEKTYFFKALIDCVVIDTEDNYKPKKFIELDSPYHDTEVQKEKDGMKDKIMAVAGQKLIRVRRVTYKEDEKDFVRLIRETLR